MYPYNKEGMKSSFALCFEWLWSGNYPRSEICQDIAFELNNSPKYAETPRHRPRLAFHSKSLGDSTSVHSKNTRHFVPLSRTTTSDSNAEIEFQREMETHKTSCLAGITHGISQEPTVTYSIGNWDSTYSNKLCNLM